MTLAQQAVVIWSLLRMAARMQRVLTYGEVEDYSGILARAQGEPLHLIYLYCKRKRYPELNSIAVGQDGFPGENYPGPMKTELDFFIEHRRVFAFGWSAKDNPSSEDFQVAQPATV
jgi:hypothetical protein